MSEVVLAAEGLTKVFADFWGRPKVAAVDDLSFEIRRGEVLGLLGPNGAGKSTTVKMILDLLRPTRGRISIGGRPPSDLRAKATLGYLPEESRLYPYLTGEETLRFFGKLFDLPARNRDERVRQLLDQVGLTAARGRRVGEYSKGMQRRLGLAQALLNDPELIILDEPTSGLDPLGIRDVKDLIQRLARRGKTVLLCSHLLSEVEDVCDRVIILYAGRRLAAGGLDELLAAPDRLTLTLPQLEGPALERVLAAVRREVGQGAVDVDVPSRSLESFFIDTINAAREAAATPAPTPAAFLSEEPPATAAGEPAGAGKPAEAGKPAGAGEPAEAGETAEDVAARMAAAEESLRARFDEAEPDA